jgi:hypothetical protein
MSLEVLWPCPFLDRAFKIGMDQATELVLAEGIIMEDADGGQHSSVKLACNVSSFFTHKTETTP